MSWVMQRPCHTKSTADSRLHPCVSVGVCVCARAFRMTHDRVHALRERLLTSASSAGIHPKRQKDRDSHCSPRCASFFYYNSALQTCLFPSGRENKCLKQLRSSRCEAVWLLRKSGIWDAEASLKAWVWMTCLLSEFDWTNKHPLRKKDASHCFTGSEEIWWSILNVKVQSPPPKPLPFPYIVFRPFLLMGYMVYW